MGSRKLEGREENPFFLIKGWLRSDRHEADGI